MNFRVGDVVEVVSVGSPKNAYLIGMQGSILEMGIKFRCCRTGEIRPDGISTTLEIKFPVADGVWAPEDLRLKRPPSYPDQFTAGDWDLIPWSPHRESVK